MQALSKADASLGPDEVTIFVSFILYHVHCTVIKNLDHEVVELSSLPNFQGLFKLPLLLVDIAGVLKPLLLGVDMRFCVSHSRSAKNQFDQKIVYILTNNHREWSTQLKANKKESQSTAGWEGEKVSRPAPARAARSRAGRGIMGLAGLPTLDWTHFGPI